MQFDEAKTTFESTLRWVSQLTAAIRLMYWDMETVMPKKAAPGRARAVGALQTEVFRQQTSEAYADALDTLSAHKDRLSSREGRMLEVARREYDRDRKLPAELVEAFSVTAAESGHLWMRAKVENDYAVFSPYLRKIVDYSRQFAEYWGYADKPYDAMLAAYDPAQLTAQIDPIFARLLDGTRSLLARVGEPMALPQVKVPPARQQAIGEYLLGVMGYDLEAGNLFTTEHPFTQPIHLGDTRVTTKYIPDHPLSSIFSVLHEGGHGLYGQNIAADLDGTNLYDGASMGIHESQSRFWENIVGRSLAFWQTHLEPINALAGTPLAEDAGTLFRAVNAAAPSLIRIEADELTYNLHIIIRYELEKAIFNDGVNCDDLPELWAAKYEEYLGVRPKTYAEGILQDSHWAGGSFGYFPSYAIGNLCAAQFLSAFEKQNGDVAAHVRTPEGMALLGKWQRENIHRYGAEETPRQIMERVCGEDVNPAFFLDYMEKKLSAVYAGF